MEEEDNEDTTDGEQSKLMSAVPSVTNDKDTLTENLAETKVKCDLVNEAEHSENNDVTKSEAKSSATNDRGFDTSTGAADQVKDIQTKGSSEISEQRSETLEDTSTTPQTASTGSKEIIPELTIVLIGETNSIEIGSKNLLVDHDEQTNVEQFSPKLYDLCGQHISVINRLGLQNIGKFPLKQEIHAFLLLLPNGQHDSHYTRGVQWLEK
ncbi:uncharacterized protein LOC131982819 [Centropristis striata]|uniref:uncharacterized protein LOC131982819 n=1 Tax=Centropristis striata TaxID=184440 RepID=UPI0027DF9142|nr:uncharacterized protein LOC131982819 [Centropristis striata]